MLLVTFACNYRKGWSRVVVINCRNLYIEYIFVTNRPRHRFTIQNRIDSAELTLNILMHISWNSFFLFFFYQGRIGFNLVLWEKTFTDSLDWCMSKDQLLLAPLNYCKMNKNKNKGVISWTNVFRDVWDRQLTKGILYCLTSKCSSILNFSEYVY